MKRKEAVPFLSNVLKYDKDPDNRWYVAVILGEIGDQSAVPVLEYALNDWNKNVRSNTIQRCNAPIFWNVINTNILVN
jgi:HEAT repeat protein